MKLIDWSRVPRGTMTNKGEIIRVDKDFASVLLYDDDELPTDVNVMPTKWLRINEQTHWTYHDGGPCPVPGGVTGETVTRAGFQWEIDHNTEWEHTGAGTDVVAYRITGVDRAGGWKDDPREVTE